MTEHNPIRPEDARPSLLERAAEVYDFSEILNQRSAELKKAGEAAGPAPVAPAPAAPAPVPPVATAPEPAPRVEAPAPAPSAAAPRAAPVAWTGPVATVDRELLRQLALIVPEGAVTNISEEFRIIKRPLLNAAKGEGDEGVLRHGERILICSAHPGEGKTYCALNLALSMAAEKDNDVLLVDADFAKPSILSSLGIEGGPGLMDALADPAVAVEDCIIHTDIRGLSVLPSGARTNIDTEYLASARTREVLSQLTRNNPARIVIFDSPPLLAASPAAELAHHVGQAVLVVKADKTSETALGDALGLLSGCDTIRLLLNGVKFSPTGRSFGSYYGYGE